MAIFLSVLVLTATAATALPTDCVIAKYEEYPRFQYVRGPDGSPQLADLWVTNSDVIEGARYNPDVQNIYHLYTRNNSQVSQPLVLNQQNLLLDSNFRSSKKTVILIPGWQNSVSSAINTVLVPAFLQAADVNVIVVDWYAGGGTSNYVLAVLNTVTSGQSVAKFIAWLNSVSGAVIGNYQIVGHGLGAHQAGIVGKQFNGEVPYITGLDPSLAGFITNDNKFDADDGIFTEVIHTNVGLRGYISPLGKMDFYPNGGVSMPGCITEQCDHDRAFYYFGESLVSGGFTGTRCYTYAAAMIGICNARGSANMGGLNPKNGTGIFHLRTHAFPPFSRN